jgi:hypothetical protein
MSIVQRSVLVRDSENFLANILSSQRQKSGKRERTNNVSPMEAAHKKAKSTALRTRPVRNSCDAGRSQGNRSPSTKTVTEHIRRRLIPNPEG